MRNLITVLAVLSASACATQPKEQFTLDGDGYYWLEIPSQGPDDIDAEKMGELLAQGEMSCRQNGKTAETGFGTRENSVILRYRCVDPVSGEK